MNALDVLLARGEFYRQGDDHMRQTIDYFRAQQLDRAAVEAHAGVLSVVRAVFSGPWFDFAVAEDPDAGAAICLEVFADDDETCADLLAWPINEPARFATMFGDAPTLGTANIENPATYAFGQALQVHRTPLEWARDKCRGVVMLKPACATTQLINALGRIQPRDDVHAREIAALMLEVVRLDRIVLPINEAAA